MSKRKEIVYDLRKKEIVYDLKQKMIDLYDLLNYDLKWLREDMEKMSKRLDRIEELLEEKVNE
jgi:hypothetical protein